MNFNRGIFNKIKRGLSIVLTVSVSLALFGCDSDSDSGTGYIQLYNLSSNAPDIYLTVDQYDDDDYNEITYSGISFGGITGRLEFDTDTYDIELAWQDEFNSSELEDVVNGNFSQQVKEDTVNFTVLTGDIKNPTVLEYEFETRDDDELDDDSDDELFNVRVLNLHPDKKSIELHYSESDETFAEAVLINSVAYTEMAENEKIEQDDLIFYITLAGSDEVLFTSEDISFSFAAEYIMVVRENDGAGTSPYILEILSTSSATEFADTNAEAQYRVYNGIGQYTRSPSDSDSSTTPVVSDDGAGAEAYTGEFDFYIDGTDNTPKVSALAFGEFSDEIVSTSGDFAMSLVAPVADTIIAKNYLLSLPENTDATVFFYLLEEAVDEDGDGDVDEDNNGIVDEYEVSVHSLVVENSQSESIYSHEVNVINFIDEDEITDDFSNIKVYFVLNDEIIETAGQSVGAVFATPTSVQLLNNTYTVKVIGQEDGTGDGSFIVLSSSQLVLDEDSKDQFLILQKDNASTATETSYKAIFANQAG